MPISSNHKQEQKQKVILEKAKERHKNLGLLFLSTDSLFESHWFFIYFYIYFFEDETERGG